MQTNEDLVKTYRPFTGRNIQGSQRLVYLKCFRNVSSPEDPLSDQTSDKFTRVFAEHQSLDRTGEGEFA